MKSFIIVTFLLFAGFATAAEPQKIYLWNDNAPNALGSKEKDKPSITVYPAEKPNGTAVVNGHLTRLAPPQQRAKMWNDLAEVWLKTNGF